MKKLKFIDYLALALVIILALALVIILAIPCLLIFNDSDKVWVNLIGAAYTAAYVVVIKKLSK